ncbi:hypothetical protein BGZ83_003911 [Gryganskiella cystojenkinii]|nr:hypothetical protein BGZ83_003911 [Gryganskiella cystojenkinii]
MSACRYLFATVHAQIDRWLQSRYGAEAIPTFERTDESAEVLSELMKLNQTQDSQARKAIVALRQISVSYRKEETLQHLSDLADLAMTLGLDDTRPESFQAGISQLHLDMIFYTRQQRSQEQRLRSLEKSHEFAQRNLEDLRDLQLLWQGERESTGDMQLRTRRRSTELSRIHLEEDEQRLQGLEQRQRSEGLEVEGQGLSIAQLEASEKTVVEYRHQVEAQNRSLAAYQQIPPDYSLATLKLREATMQLEELMAEHESLVANMADSL